ncbi:MAG: hypothetical protein HYS05_20275 [Acidobacteria bacterium]|nr:hypothetical protein [Acidobacteriota bacterium]
MGAPPANPGVSPSCRAVLTLVVSVEQLAPHGDRLARLLGVGLRVFRWSAFAEATADSLRMARRPKLTLVLPA